jgi:hypothetical protein
MGRNMITFQNNHVNTYQTSCNHCLILHMGGDLRTHKLGIIPKFNKIFQTLFKLKLIMK